MNTSNTLYAYPGTKVTNRLIRVDEQVSLRVISYEPSTHTDNYPILFIGGLSTIVDSFQYIIHEITSDFPFHFIETREHATSLIVGETDYDICSSAKDLVAVIKILGVEDRNFILMGYSMGVPVIAEGYRMSGLKPSSMIFMEPTPVFHYPGWALKLMKLSLKLKMKTEHLRPIGKWYIRNFVIDKKNDPEMVLISENAIDNADAVKLKKTVLAIAEYTIWNTLAAIDIPVLIIAATKDKMHVHEEIIRMVNELLHSEYIDLETNRRTHGIETVMAIRKFLSDQLKLERLDVKSVL